MNTTRGVSVLLAGLIASAAEAQQIFVAATNQPVGVVYSLGFTEVDTTTLQPVIAPNGTLQPGESALLRVAAAIDAPIGTPVVWSHISGGSTNAGTLGGFWYGSFDLLGDGGGPLAVGSWTLAGASGGLPLGSQPPFTVGQNGTPSLDGGRLMDVVPAQFGLIPSLSSANPIAPLWQGVWTPSNYSDRSVTFEMVTSSNVQGGPAAVWAQDSNLSVLPTSGTAAHQFGNVTIPIIPAPGTMLLGLTAFAGAARRSRKPPG